MKRELTVVGIGASAGSVAALISFFRNVPPDSGLAYVVAGFGPTVPERAVCDLLRPHPAFPIVEATGATPLQPDRAYVVPPNYSLKTAAHSTLRLSWLDQPHPQRAPVDHFLRTLANTYEGPTAAVILNGQGQDGTLGIRDIRVANGLVIVQDPGEADVAGMAQSAIRSDMADFILPAHEMPSAILRFSRTEPRLGSFAAPNESAPDEQVLFQGILTYLRSRTGQDFRYYKQSAVLRRVSRRMRVHAIADLQQYVELLMEQPGEAYALTDDLLLTANYFFHDHRIFEKLENEVIPSLFAKERATGRIRVWLAGCGSGEEAYSLAMLMLEEEGRHSGQSQIQIFASEAQGRLLAAARAGYYNGIIETDLSPARIARFFSQENGGYRVRRELRDRIVFAHHNLLTDPPFSHLDLVFCHDAISSISAAFQRSVADLFHYALGPEGILVLGAGEADLGDRFRPEYRNLSIYRRCNGQSRTRRLAVFPVLGSLPGLPATTAIEPAATAKLHEALLLPYAPPSILVDPHDEIVHELNGVGRYFVQPRGEATRNLFKLTRPELRAELRGLIARVRESRKLGRSRVIPIRRGDNIWPVVALAMPIYEAAFEGYFLLVFDERDPEKLENSVSESARVGELEAELGLNRERLENVIDQYELAKADMAASREEMRLTMEELQRSMEALARSLEEKEELLKEVHHRVKNNLQVINSLLNMQARQIENPEVLSMFDELRNRVLSIGAIHELLYRSESLSAIDLRSYAERLVPELIRFYGLQDRVHPQIRGADATLELDRAVPYGLLLNELVSNVCKHAFTERRDGELTVTVGSNADHILLEVADNGAGLPAGFDPHNSLSLGFQLIQALTRQLHGKVQVLDREGTAVQIEFPVDRQLTDEEADVG